MPCTKQTAHKSTSSALQSKSKALASKLARKAPARAVKKLHCYKPRSRLL